jgi:hypothetical protein
MKPRVYRGFDTKQLRAALCRTGAAMAAQSGPGPAPGARGCGNADCVCSVDEIRWSPVTEAQAEAYLQSLSRKSDALEAEDRW